MTTYKDQLKPYYVMSVIILAGIWSKAQVKPPLTVSDERPGIPKVSKVHPEGDMNVKFHGSPSNSCLDISVWAKLVVRLTGCHPS